MSKRVSKRVKLTAPGSVRGKGGETSYQMQLAMAMSLSIENLRSDSPGILAKVEETSVCVEKASPQSIFEEVSTGSDWVKTVPTESLVNVSDNSTSCTSITKTAQLISGVIDAGATQNVKVPQLLLLPTGRHAHFSERRAPSAVEVGACRNPGTTDLTTARTKRKRKKKDHVVAPQVLMCSLGASEDEKHKKKADHVELRKKMFHRHCEEFWKAFQRIKKEDKYGHFLSPVCAISDPEYASAISNPMDLSTIEEKVKLKEYIYDLSQPGKLDHVGAIDWTSFLRDVTLLCENAMSYNTFSDIPGNIHKEAKRILAFSTEVVANKVAKHNAEMIQRLTEEELDVVQAENHEPAVQTEWRKEPYGVRRYETIFESEPARCLSKEEKEQVLRTLTTTMSGPPPPENNESSIPDYSGWLISHKDENGALSYALKNPEGHVVDGQDLIKKDVWGIDCHTRKNIVLAIGDNMTGEEKDHFIESILLPRINQQNSSNAYDMNVSLDSIVTNEAFAPIIRKCASIVSSAVTRWEDHNFRIHPKGKGIVCQNQRGIKEGEFIKEYQGEVYPAWQWNEREQAIETLAAQQADKNVLPDFWNIQLERHVNDPDGHDILTIDPSQCSNFASRMSHSCNPNCATVCIAINNRYMVAMYSIRQINPGEELTFDYNAVTESDHEFSLAACLCGSSRCRGSFLYLTKTRAYGQIIRENHPPIVRLGALVRACRDAAPTHKLTASTTDVEEIQQKAARAAKALEDAAENKRKRDEKRQRRAVEKAEEKKLNAQVAEFTKKHGPKRPLSAFFVFLNRKREEIKLANVGIKLTRLASVGGDMWRSMSELEQQPYIEEANTKKRIYEEEKAAFDMGPLAQFREAAIRERDTFQKALIDRKVAEETERQTAIDMAMEEEGSRCDKHGLRRSALAGLPKWARLYASKCLAFVEYEREQLPGVLMAQPIGAPVNLKAAQAEALGVADQRVHNLVISMDKIRHFLSEQYLSNSMTQEGRSIENRILEHIAAPVYILNEEATSGFLWNNYGSLAATTFSLISRVYKYDRTSAAQQLEAAKEIDFKIQSDAARLDALQAEFVKQNQPKRPQTAFFIFSRAHRNEARQLHPELTLPEISSTLGEKWRSMSKKEQEPYVVEADKLRKKYEIAKQKYDAMLENFREIERRRLETIDAPKVNGLDDTTKQAWTILSRLDRLVNTWAWSIKDARRALTCLRDEIHSLPCETESLKCQNRAAFDLLTLYLNTDTFFTLHSYRPTQSRKMNIPMADVPGTKPAELQGFHVLDNPVFETCVAYDEHTVHKEMLHWYEQNNHMSLPVDLYGCVRLPVIECCFQGAHTAYTADARRQLLQYFNDEKFDKPWPTSCQAAFPDIQKSLTHAHVYGSPLFDELLRNKGEPKTSLPRAVEQLLSAESTSYTHTYNTDDIISSLTPVAEHEEENWVQCERKDCMKWRKIPSEVNMGALPNPWYCSNNHWDPERNDCSKAEEVFDKSTTYAYETEEMEKIEIGSYVDCYCDKDKIWHASKVLNTRIVDLQDEYLMHFNGWNSKHDVWVGINTGRILPLHTHTSVTSLGKRKKT